MEDQSHASHSNGGGNSTDKNKQKDVKRKGEFEFCKVCRINHNNGRGHNYFPSHTKSLSSLLSRFQKKVSGVRSSLKNPSLLRDEAAGDGVWCIFCEMDMDDIGSSFEGANAIKHLASEDHLKNLKHFLWKYGGGMNKVDTFRIKKEDVTKCEKRCAALKDQSASSTKTPVKTVHEHSTNIQPETQLMNSFDKNNGHYHDSNLSNVVTPLQYNTHENHQVLLSDIPRAQNIASMVTYAASPDIHYDSSLQTSGNIAAPGSSQLFPHVNSRRRSVQTSTVNTPSVSGNQSMGYETSYLQGFQNLTQISAVGYSNETGGNVHTGAPPPWFEAAGEATTNQEDHVAHLASITAWKKSSKLNPKRVGAAWAERRKIEMEMEKRGEIVAASRVSDVNWLPNFGSVWQSGSRKDYRKEFQKEKRKLPLSESVSEKEVSGIKIQPYVSKRMRGDAGSGS